MLNLMFILVFIALVLPVNAAIYEWNDEKGVVHFTDNPENIPAKFRVKAREKAVSGEKNILENIEQKKQPAPLGNSANGETFGGHELRWWKEKLSNLRAEVRQIEEKLPAKRESLVKLHRKITKFQKRRDRIDYNNLNKEIADDEQRLKNLQEKLVSLEAEAARAGVSP